VLVNEEQSCQRSGGRNTSFICWQEWIVVAAIHTMDMHSVPAARTPVSIARSLSLPFMSLSARNGDYPVSARSIGRNGKSFTCGSSEFDHMVFESLQRHSTYVHALLRRLLPSLPSFQVKQWKTDHHPIRRFYAYLERKGWWDSSKDRELRDKERLSVRNVSFPMFWAGGSELCCWRSSDI